MLQQTLVHMTADTTIQNATGELFFSCGGL